MKQVCTEVQHSKWSFRPKWEGTGRTGGRNLQEREREWCLEGKWRLSFVLFLGQHSHQPLGIWMRSPRETVLNRQCPRTKTNGSKTCENQRCLSKEAGANFFNGKWWFTTSNDPEKNKNLDRGQDRTSGKSHQSRKTWAVKTGHIRSVRCQLGRGRRCSLASPGAAESRTGHSWENLAMKDSLANLGGWEGQQNIHQSIKKYWIWAGAAG